MFSQLHLYFYEGYTFVKRPKTSIWRALNLAGNLFSSIGPLALERRTMRYLSNLFCFVFRSQRRTITLKKSECPVCQSLLPVHLMTSHVDSCLEPTKKVTTKIQLLFYFSISWFCRLVFQTLTRFWIRICFIYLLLEIRALSIRLYFLIFTYYYTSSKPWQSELNNFLSRSKLVVPTAEV